ncbi:MAG: hypothetical protein MJ121_03295 [Clostridia bacterium]|nr:hypothetical protein [Clostridia bacterium]
MKACKKIVALILALAMVFVIPSMAYAADDTAEDDSVVSAAKVANMYILYSVANPSCPHMWIYIENTSNKTLMVGHYKLPAGEAVSIGNWKDRGNGGGVHYNLERYWVKDETYSRTIYLKTTLTELEVSSISACIDTHDTWSWVHNCAWLATAIWNRGSIMLIPFLLSPTLGQLFMILYGAKDLDFHIQKLTNGKKCYKHTADGLVSVNSGALYTTTGV